MLCLINLLHIWQFCLSQLYGEDYCVHKRACTKSTGYIGHVLLDTSCLWLYVCRWICGWYAYHLLNCQIRLIILQLHKLQFKIWLIKLKITRIKQISHLHFSLITKQLESVTWQPNKCYSNDWIKIPCWFDTSKNFLILTW